MFITFSSFFTAKLALSTAVDIKPLSYPVLHIMINNTTPNKLLTLTINEKIDKICDESHTFLTLIMNFSTNDLVYD